MVAIHSYTASGADTAALFARLREEISDDVETPAFLYVFYGCEHDSDVIRRALAEAFPDTPFLGGTSCNGVMTETGLAGGSSIGILVLDDADGDYGMATARCGDDPAAAAEDALHRALADAGCPGELPELIWIFQAPGREEQVIDGLKRAVGDNCPIIGGSSADADVSGNWCQIGVDGVHEDGMAVAVMFPSGGVGVSFQGGYEPAGPQGTVTRAQGRHILEIDGAPAAETYNGWIGGLIAEEVDRGGSILEKTTMFPLAIDAAATTGIPHYLLIHPDAVVDGALTAFATVPEGTRIYAMRGDRTRLVERAGRVAHAAAQHLPGGAASLAGGIVIYCAGCMLAVGDQMPGVAATVTENFDGKPFLGCFTFGEQGALVDRNVHGNLMISAVAFGA